MFYARLDFLLIAAYKTTWIILIWFKSFFIQFSVFADHILEHQREKFIFVIHKILIENNKFNVFLYEMFKNLIPWSHLVSLNKPALTQLDRDNSKTFYDVRLLLMSSLNIQMIPKKFFSNIKWNKVPYGINKGSGTIHFLNHNLKDEVFWAQKLCETHPVGDHLLIPRSIGIKSALELCQSTPSASA